jgi:putative PIN family toxin of toxin-antitoxin system
MLVRANEHSDGLARELLLTVIDGEHRLVLSNELLHELARALRYPPLRVFYDLSETLVYEYISYLRSSSEIVELNPIVIAPSRDVNDLIVMQTAIIGEADVLCSKDQDFFAIQAAEYLNKLGIAVMDEIELMQRLRS